MNASTYAVYDVFLLALVASPAPSSVSTDGRFNESDDVSSDRYSLFFLVMAVRFITT